MTENSNGNDVEEPKIIVDEDYKEQVAREKELARKKTAAESTDIKAEDAVVESSREVAAEPADEPEMPSARRGSGSSAIPPASISMLVTSLASQAAMLLGAMPDESGKPIEKNLPLAKHFIDLLDVLEEKTRGNLTGVESDYLKQTLVQMRLVFVEVQNKKA